MTENTEGRREEDQKIRRLEGERVKTTQPITKRLSASRRENIARHFLHD